jgi:hypothetical protein
MSLHRRAARRDQNEPLIVSAFEARGWTVVKLSGKGLPDLLCMKGVVGGSPLIGPFPLYLLVDVKMPKGTFKPAQVETWRKWSGRGLPVYVATTAEDVLAIIHGTATPWGQMEAAPKRVKGKLKPASNSGKTLAVVEADAGNRLRVVREPGSGLLRARPSKTGHLLAASPAYSPPPTSAAQLAEETFAPGPHPATCRCDACASLPQAGQP